MQATFDETCAIATIRRMAAARHQTGAVPGAAGDPESGSGSWCEGPFDLADTNEIRRGMWRGLEPVFDEEKVVAAYRH